MEINTMVQRQVQSLPGTPTGAAVLPTVLGASYDTATTVVLPALVPAPVMTIVAVPATTAVAAHFWEAQIKGCSSGVGNDQRGTNKRVIGDLSSGVPPRGRPGLT